MVRIPNGKNIHIMVRRHNGKNTKMVRIHKGKNIQTMVRIHKGRIYKQW